MNNFLKNNCFVLVIIFIFVLFQYIHSIQIEKCLEQSKEDTRDIWDKYCKNSTDEYCPMKVIVDFVKKNNECLK